MFEQLKILELYVERFPEDQAGLALLFEQTSHHEVMNDRKNFTGHVTGAAIVLSPDHTKVLMVHHRTLDRWLQPGGHWDPGESDPLVAAQREAEEETSVQIARYLPLDPAQPLLPIQIDSHFIPENKAKNEPEHYHHDFRYAFEAASEVLQHDMVETIDARWFALDAPEVAGIAEVLARIRSYTRPSL